MACNVQVLNFSIRDLDGKMAVSAHTHTRTPSILLPLSNGNTNKFQSVGDKYDPIRVKILKNWSRISNGNSDGCLSFYFAIGDCEFVHSITVQLDKCVGASTLFSIENKKIICLLFFSASDAQEDK